MIYHKQVSGLGLRHIYTFVRLQNSPYFCVLKYARAVKMFGTRVKTESETGTIPIGLISMQAVNKLSSNVSNKSFAIFSTVMNRFLKISL